MPEHQNIEYKQSWHDDYLKWVCGFVKEIGRRSLKQFDLLMNFYSLKKNRKIDAE